MIDTDIFAGTNCCCRYRQESLYTCNQKRYSSHSPHRQWKGCDATQVGEIAKDLVQAQETKSKAQNSAPRRSTRMKKRSGKVEDNRQIDADLVLTAALTATSRTAGHRRQNFHSTQLKENQFRIIW
jgi:hypothetical protein